MVLHFLQLGNTPAWCFLWRTPVPVEQGIRAVMRSALMPVSVTNASVFFDGLRFIPDLVIGDHAIGDVIYAFDRRRRRRSDVYQLLAFAGSHARRDCSLVNFSDEPTSVRRARVSDHQLSRISWTTSFGRTRSPGSCRSSTSMVDGDDRNVDVPRKRIERRSGKHVIESRMIRRSAADRLVCASKAALCSTIGSGPVS